MWTDITNSKILATQIGLWLTWVLKVYICSLRQLSVAKTHLQQFHYLSILKLWKLTKDLCIKLGSPASEHPAQNIGWRIPHPWDLRLFLTTQEVFAWPPDVGHHPYWIFDGFHNGKVIWPSNHNLPRFGRAKHKPLINTLCPLYLTTDIRAPKTQYMQTHSSQKK